MWDVEYTDEFEDWWSGLSADEQVSLAASVQLLEERGPSLGFPHSSGINGSKHGHMRELRTQHGDTLCARYTHSILAERPSC